MADRPFGFPDNPGRQQKRNNDRLIASVASMLGLGRYEDVERITPVIVADADAPPPLQYKGWVPVVSALNAGFRSEAALTNIAGDGSVVKVWVQLFGSTATARIIRLQPTLAGYTQVNTPYADARLGIGTSGSVFAMRKNTAAANATGIAIGDTVLAGPAAQEIGPFWLGSVGAARNILVQANADAEAVNVAFRWELYAAVK